MSKRPKDSSLCLLADCCKPKYIDKYGRTHECCGYTHAMELLRRQGIQRATKVKGETHCLLPDCDEITWPFKNYCCRTHAEWGQKMGLQSPVFTSGASKATLLCQLPGCYKPKHPKSADGEMYDYCGKRHAKQAQRLLEATPVQLKTRAEVDMFLKSFRSSLQIVSIEENVHAMPGGDLYKKFVRAVTSLPESNKTTILAFHGTADDNIANICTNGYDESKRSRQAYGDGEYFATTPDIPLGYVKGAKKILLNELLLGQHGIHHTKHGDIVVMKYPAHDLPRYIVTFK